VKNNKAIVWILGGIVLVAIIFAIVLFTAGTPQGAQPPANLAPSGN